MRTLSALALLGLSGCSVFGSKWEGIWFVQMPILQDDTCETTGDENFSNANIPDLEPVATGDWEYTEETTLSDYAFMVEVMKGKGGEVFVVFGNRVFPGTADGKTLTASWEGITDERFISEHDAGYDYTESFTTHATESMTITKAGGAYTGEWKVDLTSVTEWIETDQWKQNAVGLTTGQMPSAGYLDGREPVNTSDGEECTGDCDLSFTTSCSGAVPLTAKFAGKYTEGLYGAVEDAVQDPGSLYGYYPPGYTIPYTTPYTSYY
jgi:hypothetical protein